MARKPPGFAEEQAKFTPALELADGPARVAVGRLKIGPGGRVVIPAEVRTALGVAEGDVLLATLEGDELRLMSTAAAVKRAQAIVRTYIPAGGPSLVDELIADRRKEVADEIAAGKQAARR
jgi:antitoxin PrlF